MTTRGVARHPCEAEEAFRAWLTPLLLCVGRPVGRRDSPDDDATGASGGARIAQGGGGGEEASRSRERGLLREAPSGATEKAQAPSDYFGAAVWT